MVQYDWKPDSTVVAALEDSVEHLSTLSGWDLQKELGKLKQHGLLEEALSIMQQFNMLGPLREAWRKAKELAHTTNS